MKKIWKNQEIGYLREKNEIERLRQIEVIDACNARIIKILTEHGNHKEIIKEEGRKKKQEGILSIPRNIIISIQIVLGLYKIRKSYKNLLNNESKRKIELSKIYKGIGRNL